MLDMADATNLFIVDYDFDKPVVKGDRIKRTQI